MAEISASTIWRQNAIVRMTRPLDRGLAAADGEGSVTDPVQPDGRREGQNHQQEMI